MVATESSSAASCMTSFAVAAGSAVAVLQSVGAAGLGLAGTAAADGSGRLQKTSIIVHSTICKSFIEKGSKTRKLASKQKNALLSNDAFTI